MKPPAPYEWAEDREPANVQIPEARKQIGLRFGKKPMMPDAVESRYVEPVDRFAGLKAWLRALKNPGIMLGLLLVFTFGLRLARVDGDFAGRAGLAAVFLFTALGHFLKTEELRKMLPRRVPYRRTLVLIAGTAELLFVPLLFFKPEKAGWAIIVFLVAVLPANIYAAIRRVKYGGHELGPQYLLVRLPLQAVLIAWAWWFCLRGVGQG